MTIGHNRLWKRLIDHGSSKTGCTVQTSAPMFWHKSAPVSMGSMENISKVLNCNIGDVMEFVPDNEDGGKDS